MYPYSQSPSSPSPPLFAWALDHARMTAGGADGHGGDGGHLPNLSDKDGNAEYNWRTYERPAATASAALATRSGRIDDSGWKNGGDDGVDGYSARGAALPDVRDHIRVRWAGGRGWRHARVAAFDADLHMHTLRYDDEERLVSGRVRMRELVCWCVGWLL